MRDTARRTLVQEWSTAKQNSNPGPAHPNPDRNPRLSCSFRARVPQGQSVGRQGGQGRPRDPGTRSCGKRDLPLLGSRAAWRSHPRKKHNPSKPPSSELSLWQQAEVPAQGQTPPGLEGRVTLGKPRQLCTAKPLYLNPRIFFFPVLSCPPPLPLPVLGTILGLVQTGQHGGGSQEKEIWAEPQATLPGHRSSGLSPNFCVPQSPVLENGLA